MSTTADGSHSSSIIYTMMKLIHGCRRSLLWYRSKIFAYACADLNWLSIADCNWKAQPSSVGYQIQSQSHMTEERCRLFIDIGLTSLTLFQSKMSEITANYAKVSQGWELRAGRPTIDNSLRCWRSRFYSFHLRRYFQLPYCFFNAYSSLDYQKKAGNAVGVNR